MKKRSEYKFQGEKLKNSRNKKDLTQTELAKKINCSVSLIAEAEKNNKNPRPDKINKLAEVLDIHPIELWFKDDVLLDFFPEGMTQELIEFVLDPQNIPFLKVAYRFKKCDIEPHRIESLIEFLDVKKSGK